MSKTITQKDNINKRKRFTIRYIKFIKASKEHGQYIVATVINRMIMKGWLLMSFVNMHIYLPPFRTTVLLRLTVAQLTRNP